MMPIAGQGKPPKTPLTEQKGFQQAYWGRERENGHLFRLFVDWDSVGDHINFTKADTLIPDYKPFLDRFGMIADTNQAQVYNADLTPSPATEALSDRVSPPWRTLVVYFPSDCSQADQDKFLGDFKKLVKAIEDNADTYTGSAGGWVVEDLPIPSTSEKGRAYTVFIGWKSMEDHIQFTNTQVFKYNINWLTDAIDLKHYTMTHCGGAEV